MQSLDRAGGYTVVKDPSKADCVAAALLGQPRPLPVAASYERMTYLGAVQQAQGLNQSNPDES